MNALEPSSVTIFGNFAAKAKREEKLTLEELATLIRMATAPTKEAAPWLKLARFGDQRSDKGSLRHDANVLAITGVEADYDGGSLGFYRAVDVAKAGGVSAILYTSPSHRPEAPHWRALCPTSTELPPSERPRLMNRLHGLYAAAMPDGPCDVFAVESWTASQAYYYGRVARSPHYRVEAVAGIPIDQLDALDATARGRPGGTKKAGAIGDDGEAREDAELIRCVVTGEGFHVELCALAGRYVGRGVDQRVISQILRGLMLAHPEEARDERWRDRYQSIDVIVSSAASKFIPEADRRRAIASLTHRMFRSGCSGPVIARAIATEAQRVAFPEDRALDIARNILREKIGGTKVG